MSYVWPNARMAAACIRTASAAKRAQVLTLGGGCVTFFLMLPYAYPHCKVGLCKVINKRLSVKDLLKQTRGWLENLIL